MDKHENEDWPSTTALIVRDFGLQGLPSSPTEEDLLRLLADQIAELISFNLELLLSTLYRLDISEEKVNHALSPHCSEPANVALARLVLQRQRQRVRSKREYKQPDLGEW
jgi:hypothetical protein